MLSSESPKLINEQKDYFDMLNTIGEGCDPSCDDDLVSLFEEEWLQNVTPPLKQTNEETGEIVFAEEFNFDFSGNYFFRFLKSRN